MIATKGHPMTTHPNKIECRILPASEAVNP